MLLEASQIISPAGIRTESPQFFHSKHIGQSSSSQTLPSNRSTKGFPGSTVVKNLPAVLETQETEVRSLGQEDPLEEEMATYSSILAWKISWIEEPGGLKSMGLQRVRHH